MTRGQLLRLTRVAFAYIGLWMLVALFSTSEFMRRTLAMDGNPPPVIYVLTFQTVAALIWATLTPIVVAITERLPLRGPHALRNTAFFVAFVPAFAVARALLGGALMNIVEDGEIRLAFLRLSLGIRFHHNVFVLMLIIIVTNVVLAQAEEVARERRTIMLETAITTTAIEDMRARLQPQFLFTTLDAIVARIRTAPAAADRMVVSLSYLLRRSLDFAQREDIALSDELAFVERYLTIQQLRFDENLTTRIDVDEDVLDARVKPLSLQPLVDEAVADVIAAGGGAVEIDGCARASRLHLEVRGVETAVVEMPLVLPEAEVKQCAS